MNGWLETQAILFHFGDLIEDFELFFYFNEKMAKEILIYTNIKTSESLKSLEIYGGPGNSLNGLEKPFKEVKTLRYLSRKDSSKIDDSQKLSKFFPNLQTLELEWTSITDWTFFDGQIPSLISFNYFVKRNNEVELQAIDFLKRNSQLKHLKIKKLNQEILREAIKLGWVIEKETDWETIQLIKRVN